MLTCAFCKKEKIDVKVRKTELYYPRRITLTRLLCDDCYLIALYARLMSQPKMMKGA